MARDKIKWTVEQRRAITERGRDVLVTASAGTGKTMVLSGRCVDIITDASICPDVRNILVLTFTNAAADEMRSRIAATLKSKFEQSRDRHLRKQLLLLDAADISTIDSFCQRLIREYFYKLGIDPAFSIIDEDEQRLIKSEVLTKTIDWAWEQSNLRQGLEKLLYRRNVNSTGGFLEYIIILSDFLDGVVSRQNWFERAAVLAEITAPAGDLAEKQKEILLNKLTRCKSQLEFSQRLEEKLWKEQWLSGQIQEEFIEPVNKCIDHIKTGNPGRCAEIIKDFKARFKNKPEDMSTEIRDVIKAPAADAIKTFRGLIELAILNPDYLRLVGQGGGQAVNILVKLVKKFDELYAQAKAQLGCLDFADLEHYALKLLTAEESSIDKGEPSATALELRRRYRYIFVDEYQDINSVQQGIVDRLGSSGNVFVVGDVKQSIYGFRQARPEFFLERLQAACDGPEDSGDALRIALNANFRSRSGVLDFANRLFERIMTGSAAQVDYDETAVLKAGAEYKPLEQVCRVCGPVVEMHILDDEPTSEETDDLENDTAGSAGSKSEDESLNVTNSVQRQALLVAERIRQMVGADSGQAEFQVYDKHSGGYRDVEYRDIVVLMRSLAHKANDYTEILRLAGVPVRSQSVAGYFATTEITDCLSLLKVLDNPQRDIELAAVLRSPLFRMSDGELAKIRTHSETENEKKLSFYDCVCNYCQSGDETDLRRRLEKNIQQIEQWRSFARQGNLAELIWQIYRTTGYLSFMGALPNGKQRRANLLKLHERAIQFEGFVSSSKRVSLRRFVEFIEKLLGLGQDWATAEPEAGAENAVRLMSIHKSKGLEFPVVVLAGLEGRFNKRDLQSDCLFDERYTLGLRIIQAESNSKLSSLAHQVIAEQKRVTNLAEEQRILYVAVTRARERLILFGALKNKKCTGVLNNGALLESNTVPDWILQGCQSPMEWILYAFSNRSNLHAAFDTGFKENLVDDKLFSLHRYTADKLSRASQKILRLRKSKIDTEKKVSQQQKPCDELLSRVRTSLKWRYRFEDAAKLKAKTSVSALTHRGDEFAMVDYSGALGHKAAVLSTAVGDLAVRIDAKDLGSATHLVMQKLDLSRAINRKVVSKTIERLVASDSITTAVAEQIDIDSILRFFESELGQIALEPGNKVRREWPFTFALGVDAEVQVVQGIIDMLVQTPGGLVIIDFKTDNISEKDLARRAESYQQEIELYAQAVAAILKKPVQSKWLYFLSPKRPFKIG